MTLVNPHSRSIPHGFSKRQENQVLRLALRGLDNSEIAGVMYTKTAAVGSFLRSVLIDDHELYDSVVEARRQKQAFDEDTKASILGIALKEGIGSAEIGIRLELPRMKVSVFLREHFRSSPDDKQRYEQVSALPKDMR